jgi:hypothetical protein
MSRYNEDSTYQTHQRAVGNDPGRGRPWKNKEIDVVLDGYFDGSSVRSLGKLVSRTDRSIETLLAKLFSIFRDYSVATNYKPSAARRRVGEFSARELESMRKIKNSKRLAVLLGRTEEEINNIQEARVSGLGIF